MSDILETVTSIIHAEMEKPEWKQQILQPVTRWMFTKMWPYALGIICLNFFMTIAAVSLVLYFTMSRSHFKVDKFIV